MEKLKLTPLYFRLPKPLVTVPGPRKWPKIFGTPLLIVFVNVMPKDNAAKINELVEKGMTMDEAIQKIAPGTKSSVEFTREELGLKPLKINQDIDRMLDEDYKQCAYTY